MELKTPPIAKNLRNHTSEVLAEHPQDAFGHKGRSDKDLELLIGRDLPADLRSKPQIHAIHAQPLPEGRSQLRNQPDLCLSNIMRFEHRNLPTLRHLSNKLLDRVPPRSLLGRTIGIRCRSPRSTERVRILGLLAFESNKNAKED
jgi:hypothetical protein